MVLLEPPRKKVGPDGEELSEFESEVEADEGGEEEMEEPEAEVEDEGDEGEENSDGDE